MDQSFNRNVENTAVSFRQDFNTLFTITPALTDREKWEAFKLRYQIYCKENPFEDPDDHPNGLEMDFYDLDDSLHMLLHYKDSGKAVGVVRVIKPNPDRPGKMFPVQQAIQHPAAGQEIFFDQDRLQGYCETSRLGLTRKFTNAVKEMPDGAYRISLALLGLFRGAMKATLEQDRNDMLIAVEPRLLRFLRLNGVQTIQRLGEPIKYHGLRQTAVVKICQSFRDLPRNSEKYDFYAADGLHDLAEQVYSDSEWARLVTDISLG